MYLYAKLYLDLIDIQNSLSIHTSTILLIFVMQPLANFQINVIVLSCVMSDRQLFVKNCVWKHPVLVVVLSHLNSGIFFQAKQKESNSHMLMHKTLHKVMYKCNICPFSTKYKDSIIYHRTIHVEVSEKDMIPCNLCSYKVTSLCRANLQTI